MSSQSDAWNLPKSWNRKILQDWEIDRLLTDLESTLHVIDKVPGKTCYLDYSVDVA
jgi:hypothetical protein